MDDAVKKRFSNLAVIGNFLYQISNENGEQTDYFLAKTALQEFSESSKTVDLDIPTRTGVDNFIKYLDKKIEKRKRQQSGEFSAD